MGTCIAGSRVPFVIFVLVVYLAHRNAYGAERTPFLNFELRLKSVSKRYGSLHWGISEETTENKDIKKTVCRTIALGSFQVKRSHFSISLTLSWDRRVEENIA